MITYRENVRRLKSELGKNFGNNKVTMWIWLLIGYLSPESPPNRWLRYEKRRVWVWCAPTPLLGRN